MRDDSVYLNHMIDAIRAVARYLDGISETDFRADDIRQDAVIRQVQVLGEACKLVHDYFGVDIGTVWLTARDDLPPRLTMLERVNLH